jgi:ATP-dependent Clp protease, protease subunit
MKNINAFRALAKSQPTNGPQGSDIRCEIVNESEDVITISVRGTVGDFWESNDHKTIVDQLEASPKKKLKLHINSLGGSVFDGFGIANAVIAHEGESEAIIEGVAFSAASFIAIACDKVTMHKASTYGIHRSMTATYGNSKDHEATQEWLDAIDDVLVAMYMDKTGKGEAEVLSLLDGTRDGTIMTAKEALAQGFADEIYEPKKSGKPKKNESMQDDTKTASGNGNLVAEKDAETDTKQSFFAAKAAHQVTQHRRYVQERQNQIAALIK